MLPSTPPYVSEVGTYSIEETCAHLGCCRDSLRKKTEQSRIKSDRLNDENEYTIYYGIEIWRYWFNTTKQPKTDGELKVLFEELRTKGYEATFGCKPPEIKSKKSRKNGKQNDEAA